MAHKKNNVLFPIAPSNLRNCASYSPCYSASALTLPHPSALWRFGPAVTRLFRSSALRLFGLFLALLSSAPAFAGAAGDITSLLTKNDACMLLAPDGRELVAVHGDTPLIPASTIKVLTALVGFHYLGPDYRFPTDIYLNNDGDLTVRGYGDPLLISETLQQLAATIRDQLSEENPIIRDIVLDDTYFTSPLTIPGVSDSSEPYDAPNGALCANFNTVDFKRLADGSYVSAEEQTPLLPAVLDRVRRSGLKEGRIPLSHDHGVATSYTGHLLAWFLKENGVTITGDIRLAAADTSRDSLLLSFQSPYGLSDVVSKLMEFSNNFTANQVLIAAGARAYGAPGNLEKGVRAAKAYAAKQLQIDGLDITEGSGISRENRVTARMMAAILKAFTPYRSLLRREDDSYYKTGTLKGIATRAGYLMDDEGNAYPFVVMLNVSERKMWKVMEGLKLQVP